MLELLSQPDAEFWYRPGPNQAGPGTHPRDTVLISLYPEKGSDENDDSNEDDGSEGGNGRIVIDTTPERLRQWKAQGKNRVPVTFFYNFDYQHPISRFEDDATLEDIMEAFFDGGEELTPVPMFTVGDYHLVVPGEQLEELFELPEANEITPVRYQELADDLAANGFARKPLLATLLQSGRYRRLAEPDRVRVALDQGIERFPTAVFYHRLDRASCGEPAACFDRLCDALVCAGGDPNVCLDPAAAGAVQRSSFQTPPGGGGGSPPPEDPASPS
ncbi:MAG: hypothetical protein MAG794_00002 [Gammaproteobacteria bacterium]|nr:hypothetical protein [Gammaproteobacteria bacterium]